MLDELMITIGCEMHPTLLAFGFQAAEKQRGDLQAECTVVAGKVNGKRKIRVQFSARDFFAAAVQQCRETGATEDAAALEQLLQAIKDGKNRKILGTFNMTAGSTPGEVYDQAEKLADAVVRSRGG